MGANEKGLAVVLANLEAAHNEFVASEERHQQRVMERAIERRAAWHKADLQGSDDGIFFEGATQVIAANPAELYALMLADPAQFGIRLAQLIGNYADDVAASLSA